jgi:Domain of unknown function (DUF4190)
VFAVFWLGGVGSLAALWLGITGRRQISASPDTQSGRWLANVGIALASLELLFVLALFAIAGLVALAS